MLRQVGDVHFEGDVIPSVHDNGRFESGGQFDGRFEVHDVHFERESDGRGFYEDRRVGFESQNQSFIQAEQQPDGSISVIRAGVAESTLLDNNKVRT